MEFFAYAGQTTDELLALDGHVDSLDLVFAFRDALDKKFERAMGQKRWEPLAWKTFLEAVEDVAEGRVVRGPLSEEELIVLAIVALEAQVRNGGYDLLFSNRVELTPMLVTALRRIGRDDIAAVTQAAIDGLKVEGPLTDDDAIYRARRRDNKQRDDTFDECDKRFNAIAYAPYEDLLDVSLWNFIKKNRDKISVP